jgi:hypothetical protein
MFPNGIHIGPAWLHRKEQWDLDCWPFICIHWRYDYGNGSRRIFCLWRWGIQIGGGKRWVFRLSTKALTIGRYVRKWKRNTHEAVHPSDRH